MFYLLNRASKSRTTFTVGLLASRYLKLDLMLIGFDEYFLRKKLDEKTEPGALVFSLSKRGTPMTLVKSQSCLLRKQNRASRGRKKRERTRFFRFLRGTAVTLAKGKKDRKHMFFPFSRDTSVTLAKAKPCLPRKQNRDSRERKKPENMFLFESERHGRDSHESKTVPLAEAKPWILRKKKNKHAFFSFPRGTTVTLTKVKPCLSQKQNRDTREIKK